MKADYIYLIPILFPILILGWAFSILIKSILTRSWIPVPALVKHANLENGKKMVISYEYEFGGESFTGTRITHDYESNYKNEDNLLLHEYLTKAKIIEAFVNPSKPAKSVLVRSLPGSFYFVFLGGLVFSLAGLLGVEKFFNMSFDISDNEYLIMVFSIFFLLFLLVYFKLMQTNFLKHLKVLERDV